MTVYLVGAGPGDPELLTVKAERLLSTADVVIYDRLVSPEILDRIAPWAERIDVGKDPNPVGAQSKRITTQDEINELLIDRGQTTETVVRLKGGDPFVFGRGGEEVDALNSYGIAVTIVPGITSAIAGPAAAGIPVTQRKVSSAFTVVTAHQDPDNEKGLDWDSLARLGTTLVVLMGAARAASVRKRLVSAGMSPDTPVAVIIRATTPTQETRRLTLGALGAEPIPNPAVIVIGDVTTTSLHLDLAVAHNTESITQIPQGKLKW